MEKRTAMKKELKAKYDAFRNECGHEGNFRMIIAYVMDKGFDAVSQITDEEITSMVARLESEAKEFEAQGKISIMTPEFQGWLVKRATQLVKIGGVMSLLKYITNEVFIG
jgi:hypothetical protein